MKHFTLEGYGGYRSRYDDVALVFELLEEAPAALGLESVMPPLVLPYYNGVAPDDCGISAFAFLAGGHITLHTFSFRECFFADILAPQDFDSAKAEQLFAMSMSSEKITTQPLPRSQEHLVPSIEAEKDFGPHLSLEIQGYQGPQTLDELFDVFDSLPEQINMTPIMRPYVARSEMPDGSSVTSALTMLAESHAALHIFERTQSAYFDVFSCNFFDIEAVVQALKERFAGDSHVLQLLARGRDYRELWTAREQQHSRSTQWLQRRQKRALTPAQ